jgi:hypothetical protein
MSSAMGSTSSRAATGTPSSPRTRVDLKRGIVRAFADGFAFKPATTFGTMNTDVLERTLPGYPRPNFCDLIAANPLGG